ncbi:hypothetical protein NHQ30_011348 [Ciborinia camelliae]|nr:hypothetical protein NHQ30_011348 [Ciborinia camelliae]
MAATTLKCGLVVYYFDDEDKVAEEYNQYHASVAKKYEGRLPYGTREIAIALRKKEDEIELTDFDEECLEYAEQTTTRKVEEKDKELLGFHSYMRVENEEWLRWEMLDKEKDRKDVFEAIKLKKKRLKGKIIVPDCYIKANKYI